jgi:hypothetical protein
MAAHTPAVNPEPTWRLYSALAELAGVAPEISVSDPRVVVGELLHEDGRRFVWFINMLDAALRCEPRLRRGALSILTGMEPEPAFDPKAFELGPFGVRVLELTTGA